MYSSALFRWANPLFFLLLLGAILLGPRLLSLSEAALHMWLDLAWIGSSLAAALLCFLVARKAATERSAWLYLGWACAAWCIGTVYWAAYDLTGNELPFPSLADAAYVVSSILAIAGIYKFSSLPQIGAIRICNFLLGLCASAAIVVRVLLPDLLASDLSMLGKVVATAYPVLGAGTVFFGCVSLFLYVPQTKRLVAATIVSGILFLAFADLLYGIALLNANYVVGSLFDDLWVAGFFVIAAGAFEEILETTSGQDAGRSTAQLPWQQLGEALVPVAGVAAVLAASLSAGARNEGIGYLLLLPFFAAFILVFGVRERWVLNRERELRLAAEDHAAHAAKGRERLATVLESTSDSVLVVDRDWTITYANLRAQGLDTGERALLPGRNIWDLYPEARGTVFERNYQQALASGEPTQFEAFLDVLGKWFEVRAYPSDETLTIFFRDVTARRSSSDYLTFLARHDHLTGLYNRHRFGDLLTEATSSASTSRPIALLFFDLDEFKEVNDTFGHPAGDAVLKTMAERIRTCVGMDSVLARVGGDEFAVLVESFESREELAVLAERMISAVRDPTMVEGQSLSIGVSVGIAVSPDDGTDPDQLLQKVDIALYAAKSDGRGTYRFFDEEMGRRIAARQTLKNDFSRALSNGELHLVYQPIIELSSGRITGYEALLRWTHGQFGPISPDRFIPLAEETGLIGEVGEWVLRRACRDAVQWAPDISVAVNLSPVQFADGVLPLRVARLLGESGLPPERLELEVTESILLKDSDANIGTLNQLHALGVNISLDDFGTGYSSLSYLHRFPFSKLKIDRSFTAGLDRPEPRAIVRAAVGLGKSLGLTVTAEGVETAEQLAELRAIGCDHAQGYLLGRPIPAERLTEPDAPLVSA